MIDQEIAIVGGTGKFGQHLGKKLSKNNEVRISGRNSSEAEKIAEKHGWSHGTNQEIVEDADIVIIAVPISVTLEVIKEVGPKISEEALICDITSVKQEPIEEMKKYSEQVLGMHPMYAPSNSMQGQKIVLCPEKGKKWTEMEEFWIEHGAETHITDPETHDKAMSLVQGLMHFSELVVADVIRKSELSGEDMEEFSSPVYQLITDLTARMLNQSPELYNSIQSQNSENEDIRQDFVESAEDMAGLIGEKGFEKRFNELGEEFDLEGAQNRTDNVIEFLSGIT